jgi:hypothetical protein
MEMPRFGLSHAIVRDDPDQPKLWFPWFGPAEIGSIWPTGQKSQIVPAEAAGLSRSEERMASSFRIENILGVGDQVLIENVVSGTTDYTLDHPHDSEIRSAYLLIKHRNRTTTRPAIPLTFRGRNELLNANYQTNVLFTIEHRIDEYLKKDTSKKDTSRTETKFNTPNTYAKRVLLELKEIQDMLGISGISQCTRFCRPGAFARIFMGQGGN